MIRALMKVLWLAAVVDAQHDYHDVEKEIVAAIDVNLEVIGPALIRLGWHSAATYSAKEVPHGGSNGATMRFEPEIGWEDNAGLNVRRERERARA